MYLVRLNQHQFTVQHQDRHTFQKGLLRKQSKRAEIAFVRKYVKRSTRRGEAAETLQEQPYAAMSFHGS